MTDAETPPEAPIEERFRIVHDHLDLVDQTLDELTGELETELEAVLEDTPINIEYDIDTDSFQAALSIEHVVSRLNERLEPRCSLASRMTRERFGLEISVTSTILILRPSLSKKAL